MSQRVGDHANGPVSDPAGDPKDEWWIDYVEDELEPSLKDDLELLLKNSPAEMEEIKSFERLRELVHQTDDVVMTEDGRYYDQLHLKIMSSLEALPRPPKTGQQTSPPKARKIKLPSILGTITLSALITIFFSTPSPHGLAEMNETDVISNSNYQA